MTTWKRFTAREDSELRRLHKAGATSAQIAAHLGRSVASVKWRVLRLKRKGWL